MTHTLSLNPLGGARLPDIRQAEAAECGLACLAMVSGYHGQHLDLGHAAAAASDLRSRRLPALRQIHRRRDRADVAAAAPGHARTWPS